MNLKRLFSRAVSEKYYQKGKEILNEPGYIDGLNKIQLEHSKTPLRTDVINYLFSLKKHDTTYLEIGVRNPDHNFNHIKATKKYSVDPGLEFKPNPVDFKMTSDEFFEKLENNEILSKDIQFDVIFIDGLHLAMQVDKDIQNAIQYLKEDGFIVLHDCNPPTEWHAREDFNYRHTPADVYWNGTTWKAYLKWRSNESFYSCCIDSDWGVGILSKKYKIGQPIKPMNFFFEYSMMAGNRKESLNLMDFEIFKKMIEN